MERCSSVTIVVVKLNVVTQTRCPGNCHSGGAASDRTDSLERAATLRKQAVQQLLMSCAHLLHDTFMIKLSAIFIILKHLIFIIL